jgi:hypothetical protein
MSVAVVTLKGEDRDSDGLPIGPVVVIRAEGADAEAAAAAVGVPFRYRPEQAEDLGWKSYREAVAIAGERGVPLTEW